MTELKRLLEAIVSNAHDSFLERSSSTAVSAGNVLFMFDTVTRLARAQREVGPAVGEPLSRQGYPRSVFSKLPRIDYAIDKYHAIIDFLKQSRESAVSFEETVAQSIGIFGDAQS